MPLNNRNLRLQLHLTLDPTPPREDVHALLKLLRVDMLMRHPVQRDRSRHTHVQLAVRAAVHVPAREDRLLAQQLAFSRHGAEDGDVLDIWGRD
jgi:hypothetical protein